MKVPTVCLLLLALLPASGCTRRMPKVDLGGVDPDFLNDCRAHGALVLLDERYEDYWSRSYDNTKARLLGQMQFSTVSMTLATAVRRRLLRIESEKGAERASTFSVIHYQELTPPVEANAWLPDGTPRGVNLDVVGTQPLVDWPCRMGYPRRTTYRIGPLNPGDTVEILYALSGAEQELWRFGDAHFCTLASRATFGHRHDTGSIRLDMDAVSYDGIGAVARISKPGEFPKTWALTRPLGPSPAHLLPFVARSGRCRGWAHLHARMFHTPIWMARDGGLADFSVPEGLVEEVVDGGRRERIQILTDWLHRIPVDDRLVSFWMRWLPREPAREVGRRGRGSRGGIAALAFRVLEEAGLEPRFAVIHVDRNLPFAHEFVSPLLFDQLAVVVADDAGVDHWIVPGIPPKPDQPIPDRILYHKALVMERWVAERITGGGSCWPFFEVLFSCYNPSKALKSMRLVTVGE